VVVIGTLRGVVHAGYPDNQRAVVIALNLTPLQLRIGPLIAIPEEGQNHRGVRHPEVARVLDDQIVIEPYNGKL
jgi:septum site-determining protein MinC